MKRTPYQGVTNIIRFNPSLFIIAGASIWIGVVALFFTTGWLSLIIALGLCTTSLSLLLSLGASHWIYDRSDIYHLPFLSKTAEKKNTASTNKTLEDQSESNWLSINAGFDEISTTIEQVFPDAKLHILDFYNPELHTEASIARARKAYPPHPKTISISSHTLPLEDHSVHQAIAFFSLHEIRDHQERVSTFKEIHRTLTNDGELYLTEHIRDIANLAVYSIGAFHFHTRSEWLKTFSESGFKIKSEKKTTLFITTFTLIKA